jgi:hypothetical protein
MVVRQSSARALPDAKDRKQILDRARMVLTEASKLEYSIQRFEAAQRFRLLREYQSLCARGLVAALMQSAAQQQANAAQTASTRLVT